MAAFNTSGLPPVLTKLLAPWLDAIEASEPGMGNHVMAIAEHGVDALRYRIEMTPMLEQAFFDARAILAPTPCLAWSMPLLASDPCRVASPTRTS
ncbi:hypothetical protein ACLBX9_18785 [Methylobacterium sp. A49B]